MLAITENHTVHKSKLVTVKMLVKIYEGMFTEASMRWLIFNEYQNGLHKCLRRPTPGRLFVNLDDFEAWLNQEKPASR